MPAFNIAIIFYGDLPYLKRCVESLPDDVPVYLADGRYVTFPGETDLTPGAAELADRHSNVTYCAPPDDRLPFGGDTDFNPTTRRDNMLKAEWVFYEILPQDEWCLKLDADEVVETLDPSLFDALDRSLKYSVQTWQLAEGADAADGRDAPGGWITPTRIWVPGKWTYWLDDQSMPREDYPRDTPAKALYQARQANENQRRTGGTLAPHLVTIINDGRNRPNDYYRRRQTQRQRYGAPTDL